MKIGIGTYSFGGIASYLGLGPTLLEKFQTIAGLGFKTVELLPVDLAHSTEDIKKWLAETGLEVVSIHAEPTEEVIDKMAELGGKAVIWAGTDFCNKAEAIEVAEQLEKMAEYGATKGIKVGYHNHSSEFFVDEGKTLLEHLIDNTKLTMFQLDCGWAMNAGTHPASFIRRNPGRIVAIHIKENAKVRGPGERPASRHAEKQHAGDMFAKAAEMSLEERQAILAQFEEMMKRDPNAPLIQCPIAAPESNIDWKDIKAALDESSPEAFWIVEREEFYDEHDKCIADDCKWLTENIK